MLLFLRLLKGPAPRESGSGLRQSCNQACNWSSAALCIAAMFQLLFSRLSLTRTGTPDSGFERKHRCLRRDPVVDSAPTFLQGVRSRPGKLGISQPKPDEMTPNSQSATAVMHYSG